MKKVMMIEVSPSWRGLPYRKLLRLSKNRFLRDYLPPAPSSTASTWLFRWALPAMGAFQGPQRLEEMRIGDDALTDARKSAGLNGVSGLIFPPNVPRHRDSEDNALVRPDAEYLKRLMTGFGDVTKPTTNIRSQSWNAGRLDRS